VNEGHESKIDKKNEARFLILEKQFDKKRALGRDLTVYRVDKLCVREGVNCDFKPSLGCGLR